MIKDYSSIYFNDVSIIGRDISPNYVFKLSNASVCKLYFVKNEVVGFVIYDILSDRCEIVDICVSLAYRTKGIGTKLLNYVIDTCKSMNLDNITLEVRTDNKPALKLYYKCGFETVSIRKNYYSNSKTDAYLMIRKL